MSRIAVRLRGYFSRRLFGLADDAEDLVQESLLALHLQRGTYDPDLAVSAWVYAIARHKLVDLLRRRSRREALNQPLDDLGDARQPVASDNHFTRRDLAALLDTLPAAQRQAIELTKLEGLSVSEASMRSAISELAIKVQVHRGLKRLAALVKGSS